jgi:hypothetical protein
MRATYRRIPFGDSGNSKAAIDLYLINIAKEIKSRKPCCGKNFNPDHPFAQEVDQETEEASEA